MKRLVKLAVVCACILAVFAWSEPSYAVVGWGDPQKLGTYSIGTNWRSPLENGSAECYDSNHKVPIYLVDHVQGGNDGMAYSKGDSSFCRTHIELDRQVYTHASTHGKAYMRDHELDHLRGWTHHSDGHIPNHDGTRTDGENAARYADGTNYYPVDIFTFNKSVY